MTSEAIHRFGVGWVERVRILRSAGSSPKAVTAQAPLPHSKTWRTIDGALNQRASVLDSGSPQPLFLLKPPVCSTVIRPLSIPNSSFSLCFFRYLLLNSTPVRRRISRIP